MHQEQQTKLSDTSIPAWLSKYYPYILAVVAFFLFKLLFPYPDVFLDSVNYLQWGLDDYKIAFRPLGYTHFLMMFSGHSSNYINIVWVQFFVFLGGSAFLLETLFSIFRPGNVVKWACWLLTIFNPLVFFVSNLISTDGLFAGLTGVWLACLIQILYAPKGKYVYLLIQLIAYILLFSLRYNALYYPLFAIGAFLLFTRERLFIKIIPCIATAVIAFYVYNQTCETAEKEVNTRTLSGFGGWIMANNAIHIYRTTDVDSNIWDDDEYKQLHRFVLLYKDSINDAGFSRIKIWDRYMWSNSGPLKKYLRNELMHGKYPDYLVGWWGVSPMYNTFGKTLIMHYPMAFLKTFYLPNFEAFFFPTPEVLVKYGDMGQHLTPAWQQYFGVNKELFTSSNAGIQEGAVKGLLYFYFAASIITVICAIFIIIVYIRALFKRTPLSAAFTTMAMLSGFYLVSIALLAFAHPILLRYTLFLYIYFTLIPVFFFSNKMFRNKQA